LWEIREKADIENSGPRQESRRGRPENRSGRQESGRAEPCRERARSVGRREPPYGSEMTSGLGRRSSSATAIAAEPKLAIIHYGLSKIPVPASQKAAPPPAPLAYQSGQMDSYHDEGQVEAPTKSASSAVNTEESTILATPTICSGRATVPSALLDARDLKIKALEETVQNLLAKGARADILFNQKNQRIEELTEQLTNLRTMYERVTQQNWTGF